MREDLLWEHIRAIYHRRSLKRNAWAEIAEWAALVSMGLLMAWMLVEAF